MRLRLLIEVEAGDLMQGEVASAIETNERLTVEMPGWGSAVSGVLVGAVPVDEEASRV